MSFAMSLITLNRSWRADRSTREWNCLALLHPSPPHHLSPGPILHPNQYRFDPNLLHHLCCKTGQLIERKAHHSRSCRLSAVWRIAPGGGTSLNYMHCSTQPHTFCSDDDDWPAWIGPFCSACKCQLHCPAPRQQHARPLPFFQTSVADPRYTCWCGPSTLASLLLWQRTLRRTCPLYKWANHSWTAPHPPRILISLLPRELNAVCCTFSCWLQCFHRRADHWRGRIAWALAFSCMLLSIPPLPQEPCLELPVVALKYQSITQPGQSVEHLPQSSLDKMYH